MLHTNQKMRGFLMTEAVLSLFVLTMGLVTVLALVTSSLRQSFEIRDTIIAVELAQEGVELVRNVRDNGFINNPANPFDTYFLDTSSHCLMDYSSNLVCSLGSGGSYALQYNAQGFYNHSSGTASKFSRYIYVDYDSTDQTALVRSFVYWGGGASGMFTVTDAGGTGDTTKCTVAKKCVFTEISLTNWK